MNRTEYHIENSFLPVSEKYKIALVSDLHERLPDDVLKILNEETPNIIAVAGDLFENHEDGENLDREDYSGFSRIVCKGIHFADRLFGKRKRIKKNILKENAYRFLREASQIAPVVMSIGNHELYYTNEDMQVINELGITLLDDDHCMIDGIAFGGLTSRSVTGKLNMDFLDDFSKLSNPKILLCHHPEYFAEIKDLNIDLILTGHCHGGQIRIFNQGVFSPGQGLFPKYTKGVYDKQLVVSAGCSNTASIPRLGNPTEVVIIKIMRSYHQYRSYVSNRKT